MTGRKKKSRGDPPTATDKRERDVYRQPDTGGKMKHEKIWTKIRFGHNQDGCSRSAVTVGLTSSAS